VQLFPANAVRRSSAVAFGAVALALAQPALAGTGDRYTAPIERAAVRLHDSARPKAHKARVTTCRKHSRHARRKHSRHARRKHSRHTCRKHSRHTRRTRRMLARISARKPGKPRVSPPKPEHLPAISGTAQEGQTLSASTGTWSGEPTSYDFQWLRCSSLGSSCTGVSGANLSIYGLGHDDVGSTMRVRVTATNSSGSTSATSAETAVVTAADAPAPTPPPTSDPLSDESKLSWAPPPLTNPITINVSDTQWLVSMDPTKDYIVRIGHQSACAPAGSNQSGLWLDGGHNVVLIGGHVSIPCESTSYGRTGIKIRNATGTVHVEGVLIDNAGGYLTDGIAIAAPQATVQLENLRVGPTWDWTTAHPDLVQVQGGVAKLRVDKLTGIPTYQGMFLKDEAGIPNGPTDLRRVNLKPISGLGVYKPNRVFWQESKDIAVTMSDFYVDRSGYQARAFKDMPNPGTDYVCCDGDTTRYATLAPDGLSMTWAGSNIAGTARDGNPPSGDFVPSGTAGEGYVSPGYR
jgi:hypothetical protein